MWTERPSPLKDGLIIATTIVLAATAALYVVAPSRRALESQAKPVQTQCQEVIVRVNKEGQQGQPAATCPVNTWLDITEGGIVVCRCGKRPPIDVYMVPPDSSQDPSDTPAPKSSSETFL